MLRKTKKYTEAELITQFNLKRVLGNNSPLMQEWLNSYVIGKFWNFMILKDKAYFISKSYDCTEKEELMQIIRVLLKFTEILEAELLN